MLEAIVAGPEITLSTTGNPEEEVGTVTANGASPYAWPGIVLNEAIVLLAFATMSVCVRLIAALQFVLPDCDAVMVDVPAPMIVRTLLDTLATFVAELL